MQDIERRLWNWADWTNGAGPMQLSRGRCGSAERNYDPRYEDPSRLPKSVMRCVDEGDALFIDHAVACMAREEDRRFIKARYLSQLRFDHLKKRFRLESEDVAKAHLQLLHGVLVATIERIRKGYRKNRPGGLTWPDLSNM